MKVDRDGTARVEFEVRFPRTTKGRRRVGARLEPPETPALRPAPAAGAEDHPPARPRVTTSSGWCATES